MKIMDIKVFREIKQQKFRSLLIISIVAVTIAMVLGMRAGYPMVMASYEENLKYSNVADGRFTFTAPIPEETAEMMPRQCGIGEKMQPRSYRNENQIFHQDKCKLK